MNAGRTDALILLLGCTLAAAVFAGSLRGDFVYDDLLQIVNNELIQDPSHAWKALTSDVWAFQGDRSEAWTNSWRPTFVAWLMLNCRLFGIDNTLGWHLGNILLHVAVCAVLYGLLRRLTVARPLAAAIMFLFAVHPVHVESVAWISGSPDLLATLPLLGALWCELAARRSGRRSLRAVSCVLFAVAILAKELGIVFPAVVFAALLLPDPRAPTASWRARLRLAVHHALPHAAVAVAYLIARSSVLGKFEQPALWRTSIADNIATIPSLVLFYVRQALAPVWLAPSYPLRPVAISQPGLFDLALPLVGFASVTFLLIFIARRDPLRRFGLVLFFLPLLPAMNITGFIPEQLVHDRYLYLPLLGLLLVVVPALQSVLLARRFPPRLIAALVVAVCTLLSAQTIRYTRAWTTEPGFWEYAARMDPTSAFNQTRYANCLLQAGRRQEARRAFDLAIKSSPGMTYPYLGRAQLAVEEGRFADAEQDLRLVLSWFDTFPTPYEMLATCYARQSRFDDAADTLRQARDRIPYRRAAFTGMLAAVLRQADRKAEALAELEAARPTARREYGPASKLIFYDLGGLYSECARREDARHAYDEYLASTSTLSDPRTKAARQAAIQALAALVGPATSAPSGP
jgi:tetratricopeptide (TPR) repeat protein